MKYYSKGKSKTFNWLVRGVYDAVIELQANFSMCAAQCYCIRLVCLTMTPCWNSNERDATIEMIIIDIRMLSLCVALSNSTNVLRWCWFVILFPSASMRLPEATN